MKRDKKKEKIHELRSGKARSKDAKMLKSIGLKNKDLIGIPWLLAFALRDDGWFLRQDIIWSKPNAMPESVKDRCVKAHEYIFLLSKSDRYYFDHEAIKEKAVGETWVKTNEDQNSPLEMNNNELLFRNRRSVWSIPVSAYKSAHIATYPEELVTICVSAGTKEGDVVLDPFTGSGTTGAVSVKMGRQYIGIDINDEYLMIAKDRIDVLIDDRAMPLFEQTM